MLHWAESDLAWDLAEAVGSRLADRVSGELYTAIGAGDTYTAIKALLQMIVHRRVPISPPLVDRLTTWLAAYVHTDDAPHLRELLDVLRSLTG